MSGTTYQPLETAVCDDEPRDRQEIMYLVQEVMHAEGQSCEVSAYGSGLQLLEVLYSDMSREQLATVMYRYAKLTSMNVTQSGDMAKFSDAGAVSGWASSSAPTRERSSRRQRHARGGRAYACKVCRIDSVMESFSER